mmetsp:Transcript_97481/g.173604  ORF Transcript_97481/g.173604 Transcript_97481/m.173604 type:complete len:227 (-) Transcript_97481:110-790(-)
MMSQLSPPMSPLAAEVTKRSLSQPAVAVVHTPSIRKLEATLGSTKSDSTSTPSSSSSTPVGSVMRTTGSMVLSPANNIVHRQARYPASKSSLTTAASPVAVGAEQELRMLSPGEVRKRSKEAVEHFHHARKVNERTKTLEDLDLTMSVVRRKKAELDEQREAFLELQRKRDEEKAANDGGESGGGVKNSWGKLRSSLRPRRPSIQEANPENDLLKRLAKRKMSTVE